MTHNSTPTIEEMVEEFWKRYGASDERKDWLRTALTTIDQNAREEEAIEYTKRMKEFEKEIREEERKRIIAIVENWMETANPSYAQDLFQALSNPTTK